MGQPFSPISRTIVILSATVQSQCNPLPWERELFMSILPIPWHTVRHFFQALRIRNEKEVNTVRIWYFGLRGTTDNYVVATGTSSLICFISHIGWDSDFLFADKVGKSTKSFCEKKRKKQPQNYMFYRGRKNRLPLIWHMCLYIVVYGNFSVCGGQLNRAR